MCPLSSRQGAHHCSGASIFNRCLFCKYLFDFIQIFDKPNVFHLSRIQKTHIDHMFKLGFEMIVITV